MNVWRPIGRSVTTESLAMVDARTFDHDDLVDVTASFPEPREGAFSTVYTPSKGFETAQVQPTRVMSSNLLRI